MIISKVESAGLRGFAIRQSVNFAVPNGTVGSGLTVLVGPNNSGKSTIVEALNAFTQNSPPSFTEGKRNIQNGKNIEIVISDPSGKKLTLKTVSAEGSETAFIESGISANTIKPFILPSRRMFSPYFSKSQQSRDVFIQQQQLPSQRGGGYHNFAYRLFQIQTAPDAFNTVLERVLNAKPKWYIEQADNGNYYLKFVYDQAEHTSDGAGEGLLSIFTIVDAIYDSKPDDLIVIDEPELSVHPSLQKKLLELLIEYSKDRQIIISTHSPYFIDWNAIAIGAKIVRVVKESNTSKVYELSDLSVNAIKSSLTGINNPHVYGLTANEVFFLNENIILVEGQEDVIVYQRILQQLGILLTGDFYGWGVGGADNMRNIANILKDLGFKKVVGVLDKNKAELIPAIAAEFPDYSFFSIPEDDIRDKKSSNAKPAVIGIATSDGVIKEVFKGPITDMFQIINKLFNS